MILLEKNVFLVAKIQFSENYQPIVPDLCKLWIFSENEILHKVKVIENGSSLPRK